MKQLKKSKRNTRISMEKDFKKAKKTFEKLKLDPSSAAFAEEILDKKLLLKLKKSKYATDKNFFNVVNLLDNNVIFDSIDKVNRTDYVEKREIDHSTLIISWKKCHFSTACFNVSWPFFMESIHVPYEI